MKAFQIVLLDHATIKPLLFPWLQQPESNPRQQQLLFAREDGPCYAFHAGQHEEGAMACPAVSLFLLEASDLARQQISHIVGPATSSQPLRVCDPMPVTLQWFPAVFGGAVG
jgi:hypothetical protein